VVLRRRHGHARESGINAIKQVSNSVAESLRTDCNGKSDKHNEHGVLGGSCATLIAPKRLDQREHRVSPLVLVQQDRKWGALAIASLPMLSLTILHQGAVHLAVRKSSAALILLDFEPIAGEFQSV
jgi:hypothetical protein